jgi:16S rRNA (uracil1498-N3)-methyltransferase
MNDNNNPERTEPVQSPGPDAPVTPPLAAAPDVADKAPALAAGWEPLQLGRRVLRTETAGLAALAAVQTRFGDFTGLR